MCPTATFFFRYFSTFGLGPIFDFSKKLKNEWKELQYFLHPDSLNVKYVCLYLYLYLYSIYIYIYIYIYTYIWASLLAQIVKNLPAMQDTQVPSLGQEDPLEERMAAHSSFLAWRIPWTEEPSGL